MVYTLRIQAWNIDVTTEADPIGVEVIFDASSGECELVATDGACSLDARSIECELVAGDGDCAVYTHDGDCELTPR